MGKYSVRLVRKGSKPGDGCVCTVKKGGYQSKRGRPKKQVCKAKKRITPQLLLPLPPIAPQLIPPPPPRPTAPQMLPTAAQVFATPMAMTWHRQTAGEKKEQVTLARIVNKLTAKAQYSKHKSFAKRIRGF